jgi:hypothetical protein
MFRFLCVFHISRYTFYVSFDDNVDGGSSLFVLYVARTQNKEEGLGKGWTGQCDTRGSFVLLMDSL